MVLNVLETGMILNSIEVKKLMELAEAWTLTIIRKIQMVGLSSVNATNWVSLNITQLMKQ